MTSEHTGSWIRKDRRTQSARGVVVAAGALGTNQLTITAMAERAMTAIPVKPGAQTQSPRTAR
ncbi:MAG TPA: hypothetical protein VKI00_31675 [Mycobacterium sp.]|uniref:hypothetical protein n=1 Tax=Mycobacterium sp. TaxID=1785 RepID=UPI002BC9FAF7|nr:hypothetical protein [Mycobacterium sp.]HME80063.1 hypothetical protein [Mycobacterium sp.]